MINSQFVLHFSLNIISYMHSPILLQYTFLVKSLSRVQLSMTPWTIYIVLEGLRGFHWEPVSLHLSVLCLLWQLHVQAGSPMWLKDSCHAFNLHLCRYKFNDRKAPTNELALSLVLVGYYIHGWKITEMGGTLHWPFPSYIIHLWRELGKTGFSKERKGVVPKEGVMYGGWSGNNKEWPQ